MPDFIKITSRTVKERGATDSHLLVVPQFVYGKPKDLLVRGGKFYAVWDEEKGKWGMRVSDLSTTVDDASRRWIEALPEDQRETAVPSLMRDHNSQLMNQFNVYARQMDQSNVVMNQRLLFKSDVPTRDDHSTKQLSYDISAGDTPAYDELFNVLFEHQELIKLEWAVGSVLSGAASDMQKFYLIFGRPGTGKGSYLNLIRMLFEGYCGAFNVSWLGMRDNQFALEQFSGSPLVAIDQDGDLSRLESNTVLNSLVSHEEMSINEKHKSIYSTKFNTTLFIGSNSVVKITDVRSGIIRRLIDIHSSGETVPPKRYEELVHLLKFELPHIAHKCRERFLSMGAHAYSEYIPTRMLYGSNSLHNFVSDFREELEIAESVQAVDLYRAYVKYMEASGEKYPLTRKQFMLDIVPYFEGFSRRTWRDGKQVRNLLWDLKTSMFDQMEVVDHSESWAVMTDEPSLIDTVLADCPAQYASESGIPLSKWEDVTTTLADLDTTRLHFVKPPLNHIVIDFDLKGEDGEKDAKKNLAAVRNWPPTYAEVSKGGAGIHLHYLYESDVERLARVFGDGIEIKVFTGNSSLRRRLTKSTGGTVEVARLSSGLPVREESVISSKEIKTERSLRALIERNLRKEIHPGTKPSVDFIHKILKDVHKSGLVYDVTDLRSRITNFAMNSSNQSNYCLRLVQDMQWRSEEEPVHVEPTNERLVYFDCEVYPNFFGISWKYEDSPTVNRMINPTPLEVGKLFEMRLVGFNNRKYDNHILWGRFLGYDNAQLYALSQRIISGDRDAMFAMAYGASYADVYDYASVKKSLKAWQIELGLNHVEIGIPWDRPITKEQEETVMDYCDNDVVTLEAIAKARIADFRARQILAELSGLPVNATTNNHSARIIFGEEKNPQDEFVYTDLSEMFPGYEFSYGKSSYKGVDPSEGGYVYAEPGLYKEVFSFDVAGMHPASIIALNLFGDHYTDKFQELVDARLAIKHKDYTAAGKMLGGKLLPYLQNPDEATGLANALKIVVNSVYGLTSASFPNPFRDPRNVDNIVAKRGALFMIDLKEEIEARGFKVVHIKTDGIKVVQPTEELHDFIFSFGERYGYTFEVEAIYHNFCLVNKSVYVAEKVGGKWDAVGTEFIRPYVFKTLFSKEPLSFDDYVETKSVKTSIWLRRPGGQPIFHGKVGGFVPVLDGGYELLRQDSTDPMKFSAVTGTKGYLWKEAAVERIDADGRYDNLDFSYYEKQIADAEKTLTDVGGSAWWTTF